MRPVVIVAAGLVAFGLSGGAKAAEVSEQGARELKAQLGQVLSDDLVKSGFVTVKPATNIYEVTFDLAKFFDKISSADFAVTGFKPLTMLVGPLEGGLWSIEGKTSLDISMRSKLGHHPEATADYSLASLLYSGVFDPAISYLRSADVNAKDVRFSSNAGPQKTVGTAAGMTYKMAAIDSTQPHRVDFHATGNIPSLKETVSTANSPDTEVTADSLDFTADAVGVPVHEVRDLIRFLVKHVKAKRLSKTGSDHFEGLVRAALPLFSSLKEELTAANLTVSVGNSEKSLKANLGKLGYSFGMTGLTKASRLDFGMHAEELTITEGVVPAAFTALIPSVMDVQFAVPDLNFADAIDALLEADLSKEMPLSKEESERIGRMIFPGGTLVVEVPKFVAKSAAYDLDVMGKLTTDVRRSDRHSLQATILARDYDKTIAFVQNAAKADASLNQVSFGMMMAKGFAKTDPDGRQRWEVAVADDGSVTVNGQVMKKADAD
ncbi:hypothetical protein [Rhizobium sp. RAF56]|uniref:hypothetical protein n=1 Tax=Rhizobium sp. RAF56 TaxID=3233062 RepID=UPI003F98D06B